MRVGIRSIGKYQKRDGKDHGGWFCEINTSFGNVLMGVERNSSLIVPLLVDVGKQAKGNASDNAHKRESHADGVKSVPGRTKYN